MHPIVKLAKEAVESYVLDGTTVVPPEELTPEMSDKAGVFVSIKKGGRLRGCIGTFSPASDNVAEETIRNAIHSATRDPRFSPVSPQELQELVFSVDILTPPEKVASQSDLDPKRYGVIVQQGELRGLLLPDLEGVDTVDEQVRIAAQKAGIIVKDGIELFRFEVKRYL